MTGISTQAQNKCDEYLIRELADKSDGEEVCAFLVLAPQDSAQEPAREGQARAELITARKLYNERAFGQTFEQLRQLELVGERQEIPLLAPTVVVRGTVGNLLQALELPGVQSAYADQKLNLMSHQVQLLQEPV